MKRLPKIALLVALAIAAMSLVACNSDDGPTTATTATTTAAPATTTAAQAATPAETAPAGPVLAEGQISEEPIHLRVFASAGLDMPMYNDMPHMFAHSERTNVFVTWEHVPFGQHDERFNVILASGTLPDMFWNIRNTGLQALRAGGAAAEISEYLTPELMPHFNARIDEFPFIVETFTEVDGSVFFLPLIDGLATNDPLILRGDWLEYLGLPVPETLDDWLAYWIGVRDNDVSGTGLNNEVPLSVVNAGARRNYFRTWVSAFGMNDRFFVDANNCNTIIFSNVDPRYVEFLEWANMLWEENILCREFASSSSDMHGTRTAQNLLGSFRGLLNGQLNGPMNSMPAQIEGFNLIGAPPIRSADGHQLHPGVQNLVRTDMIGGVVTATSNYIREAVMFTDWFYDFSAPYGGAFMNIFGVEGLTFYFTNDERTEFTYSTYVLQNPDGMTPGQVLARYTTRVQHPGFANPLGSFRQWHPNTEAAFLANEPFYNDSIRFLVPNLPLTEADERRIRNLMADIDTYVDEQINNFIMGRRDISTFPQFIQTVERMGINEVLEIKNTALEVHRSR